MVNKPQYDKWRPRTARKQHECARCAKPIAAGDAVLDNGNGRRIHASHVRTKQASA